MLPEQLSFFGLLPTRDGQEREAFFRLLHEDSTPDEILCEVHTRHSDALRCLATNPESHFDIELPDYRSQTVRLWGHLIREGESALLGLGAYEVGGGMQGSQGVTVALSGAPVLPNPAPTIDEESSAGNALGWPRENLSFKATRRYRSNYVDGSLAAINLRDVAAVEVSRASGQGSYRDIFDEVESELALALPILSLSSREHVTWWSMTAIDTRAAGEKSLFPGAKRVRANPKRQYKKYTNRLLNYSRPEIGVFHQLLAELRRSKSRESILRAISFEIGSRAYGAAETQYLLAFAALEAAIDSVDQTSAFPSLRKTVQRKLRSHLKRSAWWHLLGARVDTDRYGWILDAMGDKPRPHLKARLDFAVRTLGTRVSDLWLKSGFASGFATAYQVRNDLIHSAKVTDPSSLYLNLPRVQLLTERLILGLLGYRNGSLATWHDQDVAWINSRENFDDRSS